MEKMPFKSKAQRRLFWAKANKGEIPESTVREWEHATNKHTLPEHVTKHAYLHGRFSAFAKLGFNLDPEELPALLAKRKQRFINETLNLNEMTGLPAGGTTREYGQHKLGLNADMFVEHVQNDDTENYSDKSDVKDDKDNKLDKAPAWGSQSSMEAGDAGTRNYQMGLPRTGMV